MHEVPIEADTAQGHAWHDGARCAFCCKGNEQAGPLVESKPDGVYICYACARLCAHVIEEESKQRRLPAPEW